MEKFDPKAKGGENSEKEKRGLDRDDTGRDGKSGYSPFAKDKRKRITRVEKNEPRPREENAPRRFEKSDKPYRPEGERHSFNPNFTKDNRRRDDNRHSSDRPFPSRDDRRPSGTGYGNRNDGDKKYPPRTGGYGDKKYSSSGGYGDKKYPPRTGGYRTKQDEERNPGLYDDSVRKPYKPYSERSDRPQGRKFDGQKPRFGDSGKGKYQGGTGKGKFGAGRSPKPNNGMNPDGTYPSFPAPALKSEMRLNRYLAAAGTCSRREADEIIRTGLVTVNGVPVTEMGAKIGPGDVVQYKGMTVQSEKKVYIVMNKPKGYVTTIEDPHADKTVMDLIGSAVAERVYPVGRLDKNSLGVLLITNDGDLTTKLTHPSHNKKKIYQVTLNKPLTRADMEQIEEGVMLEDGEIHADAIDYVNSNKKEVGIEVHSGRNRIVRRIFEHLGYKIGKLDRVYFAGLTKKNLKRGGWRFLSPREVEILKSGRYE